jgi:dTDP-4-amino-4,6-dideoxygalactose transaminase
MAVPFVDLRAQYLRIQSEIDQAISQVLESTQFIGGEKVKEFEQSFANFFGVKSCVGCANGTDAIEMALQALGIGKGDEVIVPALTWISTAEAVNNVGAEPVFVDILPGEYTINPELIEEKISKKTKAIIPVHLYGLPARMPRIMAIANAHGLTVIEDCAQAHGAKINGKMVGTFGEVATFSFYPGKNLGAYGDAGAVITQNGALAEHVRRISNHGQLTKHDHVVFGRNSRLDTLQAAIILAKLPHLTEWTKSRQQVAAWYADDLKRAPNVPEGFEHVYHLFVVEVDDRPTLIERLKKAEIGFGVHYPVALPFLQAYAYKKHTPSDFPMAHHVTQRIISLPMYAELTREQVKKVCDAMR